MALEVIAEPLKSMAMLLVEVCAYAGTDFSTDDDVIVKFVLLQFIVSLRLCPFQIYFPFYLNLGYPGK